MMGGRRVLGGVFFLFAGIVAVGILRLPIWLEAFVKDLLSTETVQVEAFAIDHIGLRGVVLGKALATFDGGSAGWEAAGLGYSWSSLRQAKLQFLDIEGLEIAWNGRAPEREGEEGDGGVALESGQTGPVSKDPLAGDAEAMPAGTEGAMDKALSEEKRRHWMSLIPFQRFQVRDGRFLFGGEGHPVTRIEFAFEARVESDRLETDISLADGLVELQANAILGPLPDEERWISAGTLDAGKAFELWSSINPGAFAELGLRAVAAGQPIRFDILSEGSSGEPARWSLSLEAEDLDLEAEALGEVDLRHVILAGWGVSDEEHLRLGVALEQIRRGPLTAGPGRFELSYEEAHWTLQSETFPFAVGSFAGTATIRGAGQADRFPVSGEGQMEVAFSELELPWAALASFSLFVEKVGTRWQVEASPLSLLGKAGISMRHTRFEWHADGRTGAGAADFLGVGGQLLGGLSVAFEAGGDGSITAQATLVDAKALNRLALTGQYAEGAWGLAIDGELPVDWIKEALATAGLAAWQLEGDPQVSLEAVLKSGPLLSGEGRLAVEALSLRSGARFALRDITGASRFRVRGWPATDGLQRLTIGAVEIGALELSSIEVEWALPTLRHLRIEGIKGRLGDGRFVVDPFALEPEQPRFSASARGQALPVQLFFDLMKETRFRVEGTVSGDMLAGWDAGAILLGPGRFTLDTGEAPARFVFKDRAFLERTVASLAGVPESVRLSLQEALLEEGITIETLNLTLGPTEENTHLTVRLELAGSCANAVIQIPIRGIVIEQRLSATDLARLLGFQGERPVRLISARLED